MDAFRCKNDDCLEILPSLEKAEEDSKVKCPKCGSTQFSQRKKYGIGKAAGGLLLAGPVGLLGGVMGKRPIVLTCLKCGHSWQIQPK